VNLKGRLANVEKHSTAGLTACPLGCMRIKLLWHDEPDDRPSTCPACKRTWPQDYGPCKIRAIHYRLRADVGTVDATPADVETMPDPA